MTGTKDLFETICSMDNLYRAFQNAKKGKGWYTEVKQIEKRPFYYLAGLQYMLKNHLYHTSEYEIFTLTEGKKCREIYKLPFFPDRIAQWAILQVIEPFLIANMTKDTYSAIPGRGIHPIVNDFKGYYKTKIVDGKKKSVWIPSILVSDEEGTRYCYKIDLHHYYQSINHEILKQKFRKTFKDPELLWVLDEIIDSISTANIEDMSRIAILEEEVDPETGIPIGNYMSQYCGNFYLGDFDHWIKEQKGVKYYYRYMDDIVILSDSKEFLQELHKDVTAYLNKNLRLSIKENYQIFPSRVRGIDFVGYRFFGEYTLLRKSTALTMKRKMRYYRKNMENDIAPTYSEWCSFNSYKGWLLNCDSYRLSKKYIEPLIEYMKTYYEREVKGHGTLYQRKLQCRCG
ncbi:MAG: RNA-directed DNA polymerase [Butyrivibrio sp.]